MTDAELLAEIRRQAHGCKHADSACGLIYFINNHDGAGHWRSWRCEKHNYSGSGAKFECPKCLEAKL